MRVLINSEETKRFVATKKWVVLFECPYANSSITIEYRGLSHLALMQETFVADGISKDYLLGLPKDFETRRKERREAIISLQKEMKVFNNYLQKKLESKV